MSPCEATRPKLRATNWTCTGEELSVVMTMPDGLPIVAPTDRLADLDDAAAAMMARRGGPQEFTGGDHLHVTLPGANQMLRTEVARIAEFGTRSADADAKVMATDLAKALDQYRMDAHGQYR